MKLYAIRHAATPFNAVSRINGQIDEELSDIGRAQLPEITASVIGLRIDHIYASPLKRAVATAEPIAKQHNCPIITDTRLMEVNAGTFQGQPYESMVPIFGMNSSEMLSTYQYDFTPYGGESASQVHDRVQSFLNEITSQRIDNVLLVTHGGTMRWIHFLCTGEKTSSQANGTVRFYDVPNGTLETFEL